MRNQLPKTADGPLDTPLTRRAEQIALAAHDGVKRKWADLPYVTHCQEVVSIISSRPWADPDDVAAGWCHDVLEDTSYSPIWLKTELGAVAYELVLGLTNEQHPEEMPAQEKHERDMQRMGLCTERVQRIKLCDILANVRDCRRTLEDAPERWLAKYLIKKQQAAILLNAADPELADLVIAEVAAAQLELEGLRTRRAMEKT